MATNRELLDGLRRGEPAAFDRAYALHRDRIYGFLVRLSGGDRPLADDLFQETFLQLARHAMRLRDDTDLGAWLFTVARNQHRAHRRFVILDGDRLRALHLGGEPAPPAPSPEAETEAGQAAARLERAFTLIAPAHREVLLLVAVEGFAHEQAAAILGLRPDALRKRLERARAELAGRLDALSRPTKKGQKDTMTTIGGGR